MKAASLRTRLFVAFAAVAVIGGVVFAILVRSLVPTFFDGNMGMRNGMMGGGNGMPGAAADTHDAVVAAVNTAMLIALGASLAVALVLAVWLSRSTLRHLDQLRDGTRALRAGNYAAQLDAPPEPELRALADDINELAATLAGMERRRASLIGDVAHEMRTPLATIAGQLEGVQDGLFTTDELVASVRQEVTRLQHLAQDLAAVSRAEEGALRLDLADVDLSALTLACAARARVAADAKGVRVTHDASAPVVVRADPTRLDQAVGNLVANAVAYTPAGGHVTVSTAVENGRAVVSVVDDGRGLSEDEQRQVFERFYRADPDDHTGGTGVGLTIARSIARAHGGDLQARSDGRGRGATFLLTLPV